MAKAPYESIKKKQRIVLFVILGFFSIGLALQIIGAIKDMAEEMAPIAGLGCYLPCFILGIVEIYLASKRSQLNENKKEKKHRSHQKDSTIIPPHSSVDDDIIGGGRFSNSNESDKKVLALETIAEFDEYIKDTFPELPFDEYKDNIEASSLFDITVLRQLCMRMQKHLGIEQYIITVEFEQSEPESKEAGTFKRTGLLFAEIKIKEKVSGPAIWATLAHELSHAYQSFKGHPQFSDNVLESEQFTDILTFYLGFKPIVEKGYYTNLGDTRYKLGYIFPGDFYAAEKKYLERTSSIHAFEKEKKELSAKLLALRQYAAFIVSYCEQLEGKYLPEDDKQFVIEKKNIYSSSEYLDYLNNLEKELSRKAYMSIQMDIIGIEMKYEELMKDYEKIKAFATFVGIEK